MAGTELTGPRRRLLIVSRESPPSLGPPAIRVSKLAKYLPEFGWDPVILSTPADHAWVVDTELADDVGSVDVVRVPRLLSRVAHPTEGLGHHGSAVTPRSTRTRYALWRLRSGAARAILIPDASILWALPATRRASRMLETFDAVLTTAPPFSTHLVGDWLATHDRLPWVADYRDNWTSNPLHRRHTLLQAVNTRLERHFLAHCDAVVVVSDAAAAEIEERFPLVRDRIVVAMNGFDPDDLPREAPRAAEFTIVHAGTLDERRDPRHFLEALRLLAARDPQFAHDARLHLLGSIPPTTAEQARASLPPDHVTIDGLVSHREALSRASHAAVLLAITTTAEAGTATLTSKLFEYLALHRPILMLAPEGPGRRIVLASGAGLAAEPDDVDAIVASLGQLHREWGEGLDRSASPETLTPFTRRETARRVAEALEAALSRHAAPGRS